MKRFLLILFVFFVTRLAAQNDQLINYKLGLAQNYELAGQFDKAEPLYKELFQLQPWNYQFFELLNKIYISQKKYNESLQIIDTKIKMTPGDPGLYAILGTSYFLMGESNKAYEAWDKGIASNQNSSITYRIIANAAIENRAYEKAIQLLNEGKKKSADAYFFSIDLANIYAANMNFGKAAEELCELVLAHPDQAGMVRNRIGSFITRPLAAKQTINAIKNFSEEHPTSELLDLLAFTYQLTGNFKKAFVTVEEIEKEFNSNGRNMFVFAQTLFDQKRFDISADAFYYILENFPKSDFVIISRINYAKALEQALDQESDSILSSWKPIHQKKIVNANEYSKIIISFNSFVKSEENNSFTPEAYFRIGEIYRNRLINFKKADSIYSKIINNFPFSAQAALAMLASGKIALENNLLKNAKERFNEIISNPRSDSVSMSEAQYYLAKIEFWSGNFSAAVQRLNDLNRSLKSEFSNDALEFSFLINIAKRDSLSLLNYANAELLLLQNKLEQAVIEFKTLADNDNLFIINQFAKNKLVEILLFKDDYFSATKLLEELSKEDKNSIFIDKSTFLLGLSYLYGTKEISKAKETFQKILEKFPNSIYFDRARVELNGIQTKNG